MVEVFYMTVLAGEQMDARPECHTLVLMHLPPMSYVVMQIHGVWDEETKQPKPPPYVVLSSVEGESEAMRIYEEQREALLSHGFIVVRGDWPGTQLTSRPN
jgi:hypothetical protein